jgi:hypothetical protein
MKCVGWLVVLVRGFGCDGNDGRDVRMAQHGNSLSKQRFSVACLHKGSKGIARRGTTLPAKGASWSLPIRARHITHSYATQSVPLTLFPLSPSLIQKRWKVRWPR